MAVPHTITTLVGYRRMIDLQTTSSLLEPGRECKYKYGALHKYAPFKTHDVTQLRKAASAPQDFSFPRFHLAAVEAGQRRFVCMISRSCEPWYPTPASAAATRTSWLQEGTGPCRVDLDLTCE